MYGYGYPQGGYGTGAEAYATGAMEITGLRPDSAMMEGVGAMEITGAAPGYHWPGWGAGAAPAAPMPMHPAAHPLHPHLTQVHHPGHHPTVHPGGSLAYGGAPRVVERPLRDMREFPLGFFQSGIGLGVGVVEVISRPQIVFRGERLVIPSITVAPNFSLVDIKIGNRSQLVNSTALPAQAFTETAIGIRLSLDTATVAQDIALSVQNISGSPQTFQAALIGTAAQ